VLLLPAERQTAIQQFDHPTAQPPPAIEKRLNQGRREKRQWTVEAAFISVECYKNDEEVIQSFLA
jgi:hypothetical protein